MLLNFMDLALKNCMYALLEVDVTEVRRFIETYAAATGERLSFTGYLAFCLAHAVAADKSVQAYRKGRKQLVTFDDVDVGMMIERQFASGPAPIGHVIRRANEKSFLEIHQEIRAVQTGPLPNRESIPGWAKAAISLPGPLVALLRKGIHAARMQDPWRVWAAMAGTVGVSSVGMFGGTHRGGSWAISTPAGHSLSLIVGGIATKPFLVDGRVKPREILCLTVAFDHAVVDGAPAARFVSRLLDLIESGYGLGFLRPQEPAGSQAGSRGQAAPQPMRA